MSKPTLPPDDLPPSAMAQFDRVLRQQLDTSITRQFYDSCDGTLQALLTSCEWYVTTYARALTLVINCPDLTLNWRVLHHVVPLANQLAAISPTARIRICPPTNTSAPFEIRVDEVSIYQDN